MAREKARSLSLSEERLNLDQVVLLVMAVIVFTMDVHLSNSVIGGYLTNEVPNTVTGMLHLAGHQQPLKLQLVGNFLRDIGGCRIEFVNPIPDAESTVADKLIRHQAGFVGEMSASRRVNRMRRRNGPPVSPALQHSSGGLKNLLFLEWFNDQHQRVIIQAWHWTLRVSVRRWEVPRELEMLQLRAIRSRRRQFLLARGNR